jgi:hypothetical protein
VRATICSMIAAGSGLSPVTRDQIRPLPPAQTAHGHGGDVRLPDPGRLKLRPEGDQNQDGQLPDALDQKAEELECRGVDPVHVLVDSQHGPQYRKAHELVDQRV